MKAPRPLREVLPEFATELDQLLRAEGEQSLADRLDSVFFHEWCKCGDGFCQSFRTAPRSDGPYGPGHRMVLMFGHVDDAMINFDLVDEVVVYVEVIGRPGLPSQFRAI